MRNKFRNPAGAAPPAVLHLVNSFAEGGTERQAVQLVNELHAIRTWNISVASLDARGPLREELTGELKDSLHEYPLRAFATWHTGRQVQRFAARMRREHICILHTHGFYPNVFGMLAGTLAGVPVRIASKRESPHLRTPGRARLEQLAFSLATRVVANCDAVRAEMHAAGWAVNKVEVIHNAINPDRVAHDGLHDGIDRAVDDHIDGTSHPRNRVVVMLANFVHAAKDHETMLQAVQLVVRQHPDVHFVLAGDGPLLPDVQARSQKLHLERHVTFSVRCRDVGALLARAAVCVLSSRLEGFPNAILEYMAAGRPVVATDVGGVREAVLDGTTGLIVAPGDAAALATALIRVLDDKVWGQNMGRAGRARVHSHFSVPHQMERITSLYARELARAEMRS